MSGAESAKRSFASKYLFIFSIQNPFWAKFKILFSRSEASKKSSSGELGYLKSTTARKLKEEEQIVKEDPYADENFATFEPDNSDDGEVYEEDFDEYDDDFEDVEFETKKEQEERLEKEENTKNVGKRGEKENINPSPDQDWEAIQNAIKRENTQVSFNLAKKKSASKS